MKKCIGVSGAWKGPQLHCWVQLNPKISHFYIVEVELSQRRAQRVIFGEGKLVVDLIIVKLGRNDITIEVFVQFWG